MARRSAGIRIEAGDEPKITMLGPFAYVSFDGSGEDDIVGLLDDLESFSDKLALQIVLIRARRAEAMDAA